MAATSYSTITCFVYVLIKWNVDNVCQFRHQISNTSLCSIFWHRISNTSLCSIFCPWNSHSISQPYASFLFFFFFFSLSFSFSLSVFHLATSLIENINTLILFYLILSYLIWFYLILSHLMSSYLILFYRISSYLIWSHLISSHLMSFYLISSYLISSHLISSYLSFLLLFPFSPNFSHFVFPLLSSQPFQYLLSHPTHSFRTFILISYPLLSTTYWSRQQSNLIRMSVFQFTLLRSWVGNAQTTLFWSPYTHTNISHHLISDTQTCTFLSA